MAQDTVFYQKVEQVFKQNSSPLIMGILNVTTDSFFDGNKYTTEDAWLEQAEKMIDEGADIIDIGAYSTRPGAKNISIDEELAQLTKAVASVRNKFPTILISADTFRATVAEKAVEAGVNFINDISGGTMDENMFKTIAKLKVPYILMHIQGTPEMMQQNPHYNNVTEEVFLFFKEKLTILNNLGVKKVILDPGFGFGKTLEHNYQLLKDLDKFQSLNCPILVGFSRKSMINKLLNITPKDALNATTVLNTISLKNGGNLLRVHDVKQAKEAVTIFNFLKTV
jgi:dihydropteroate synthase